ncbi:beta-1,3-N-acetylglucosaminyltransferase manic fringe-like [Antedon mediterranea]|uniref:beta-1,3-N-acetylglucosaminyltransferase manic fringe-like n=1 Tax=Antedon mediterranea TaxID=105859 RepID=UPI003AF96C6B
MRITLKKVLAYVFSVCIIDSIIVCVYVSLRHDKQEFLQKVHQDFNKDKIYFVNEPHFERLIKEYRSQEEYPTRILFERDKEFISNNDDIIQQNVVSVEDNSQKKINYSKTFTTVVEKSANSQHGRSEASGGTNRPKFIPPGKTIEIGKVVYQNSPPAIKPKFIQQGAKKLSNALPQTQQNKPIYIKYVQLPNNKVQPVHLIQQETPQTKVSNSGDHVNLDDIYLAVKTTQKFHRSRLQVLLDTWVSVAPQQVYFFTDADDEEFQKKTNGHMINTKCPSRHARSALCCKMSSMFDNFLKSNKSWFCHVDDDNYLNLRELRKLLDLYQPYHQDLYFGRSSTTLPIEAYSTQTPVQKYQFWFGTGGAGVCISRKLANKMEPHIGGRRMVYTCDSIRMPDDVTVGYINEILLNVPMVHVKEMNSHLQDLWGIRPNDIKNQITLSYRADSTTNTIALNNPAFSASEDPTRFKSIHCIVYPNSTFCPKWIKGR